MPLVNIVSQIPRAIIDQDRGFLHELPRQTDVFRPLTKAVLRAQSAESLPHVLAQAYRLAATAPQGPVMVEVPVDVLEGATNVTVPDALDAAPATAAGRAGRRHRPRRRAARGRRAARAVGGRRRAAGRRAGRAPGARRAARRAGLHHVHGPRARCPTRTRWPSAPAATRRRSRSCCATPTSCWPSAPSSAPRRPASGASSSHGELIHLDVRAEHIGRTLRHGRRARRRRPPDARRARRRPCPAAPARRRGAGRRRAGAHRPGPRGHGHGHRARAARARIRAAIPPEGVTTFDMTILGYWAAPHLPVERGGSFLYPLGSGTLGYAWPAALGAKVGNPDVPVRGRARRRRLPLRHAGARHRAPARHRRQARAGRRPRLRDPQGLPVGRLRGHARGRPRAARLRGAGRRATACRCSPARPTASPRRSTARWPSTAPP